MNEVQNSQEAEELKVSKKKLKEYTRKLQKTIEKLGRKNYHLKQEGRILRGLVRNYENWYRVLKSFTLIVFILEKLIVKLYLLGFFNNN